MEPNAPSPVQATILSEQHSGALSSLHWMQVIPKKGLFLPRLSAFECVNGFVRAAAAISPSLFSSRIDSRPGIAPAAVDWRHRAA
jgi:hypothetical protein